LNYLQKANVWRVYDRYRLERNNSVGSILSDESGDTRRTSTEMRDRTDSDVSRDYNSSRKQQQETLRQLMKQILDIIEPVSQQIFEKVATIPYSIRQFCKCLYEHARLKFIQVTEGQLH
jgi:hypothetical protein